MKKKLANEVEMERRWQELHKEQKGCWRLHMEQLKAEHHLPRPASQKSNTDQVGHS